MTRRLHFVGSLPTELATDYRQAMLWIIKHTHGRLLTGLPCDLDSQWVVNYLFAREKVEAFHITQNGTYTYYDDMRTYRVRHGKTLLPEHVSMNRIAALRSILREFRALRQEHPEIAAVPLQISLPNALDLALFVFNFSAFHGLRYLPVFEQAMLDEVIELTSSDGADLVWQLETPAVLIAMDKAKFVPGGKSLAARMLAKQVAGLLARFPENAQVVLHLCYGNSRNHEMFAPRDLGPAVIFLNRLATELRKRGRPLPPVHVPAAYGAHPASRDKRFYQPLESLDPEWTLIAGVAAEADIPGSVTSLELFEQAAHREVYAVGTACGLGRHTVVSAATATEAMAAAADAPSLHG